MILAYVGEYCYSTTTSTVNNWLFGLNFRTEHACLQHLPNVDLEVLQCVEVLVQDHEALTLHVEPALAQEPVPKTSGVQIDFFLSSKL
jgi:hypothetical protein